MRWVRSIWLRFRVTTVSLCALYYCFNMVILKYHVSVAKKSSKVKKDYVKRAPGCVRPCAHQHPSIFTNKQQSCVLANPLIDSLSTEIMSVPRFNHVYSKGRVNSESSPTKRLTTSLGCIIYGSFTPLISPLGIFMWEGCVTDLGMNHIQTHLTQTSGIQRLSSYKRLNSQFYQIKYCCSTLRWGPNDY